jgi:hypothetical protein
LGRKKSQEEDGKSFPGKFLGKKCSNRSSESTSTDQVHQQDEDMGVTDVAEDRETGRLCFACRYGETPGERVQIMLKDAYYKSREKRMGLEKNPKPYMQAKLYALQRGSLYGTGGGGRRGCGVLCHIVLCCAVLCCVLL